jgi:hypothetical protein
MVALSLEEEILVLIQESGWTGLTVVKREMPSFF